MFNVQTATFFFFTLVKQSFHGALCKLSMENYKTNLRRRLYNWLTFKVSENRFSCLFEMTFFYEL